MLLYLLFCSQSIANPPNHIATAFGEFKIGDYVKGLETLSKVNGNAKIMGTRYYLEGMILNKLQRYDEAENKFKKSLSIGHTSEDIFYEYGQSLYANNNLEQARQVFNKSSKKNYKPHISKYYVAHISQILEDWKISKSYYQKITQAKNVETNLLQIAHFQLAEVLLSMAEIRKEKARKLVKKYVLPQFKKAMGIDQNSLLSREVKSRKTEIQKRYDLDPSLYRNGKAIPKEVWRFNYSQELRYDNNITLATDLPTSQATQKDSNIIESTLQTSYTKTFLRKWTVSPNFRFNFLYHQDRDASEVFQNDSYKASPTLKSSFQHKLFGRPAAFLLDWDWDYTARDKDGNKQISFYAKSSTYTFGEKFQLFGKGDTTVKIKLKSYQGHKKSLDNKTQSITADHVFIFPSGSIMILFFSFDIIDAQTDSSDQTSFLSRVDYIIPGVSKLYILNLGISANFVQNKLAKTSDTTLSPSIKLSKKVSSQSKINISHEYTKKISDSISNDYTKQVTAIEYKFNF